MIRLVHQMKERMINMFKQYEKLNQAKRYHWKMFIHYMHMTEYNRDMVNYHNRMWMAYSDAINELLAKEWV